MKRLYHYRNEFFNIIVYIAKLIDFTGILKYIKRFFMKKSVLLGIALILSCIGVKAQFSISLSGSPINTTGWTLNAPTTYPNVDTLVLNDAVANTAGYAYYTSGIPLTHCAAFTIDFDFQMKDHSTQGAGEGMACYILSAPPASSNSANLGVPSNFIGAALFLDTYDDDALPDNPLASLRVFNNMAGGNYAEGTSGPGSGAVGAAAPNLSFLTNGQWQHCKITYNNGAWAVYFNNNIIAAISGNRQLNLNTAYFGFSSATNANQYSKHSIKNVYISGVDIAMPSMDTTTFYSNFCWDTLSANPVDTLNGIVTGDSLIWYDASGTPLAGTPTIQTGTQHCDTFYVSQYISPCGESPKDTVYACVVPPPLPPSFPSAPCCYCVGDQFFPFPSVAGVKWYTDSIGGVGDTAAPIISTAVADTFTFYVARYLGDCEGARNQINIYVREAPNPDFTYDIVYGCAADTVTFTNLSNAADSYVWLFGDGSSDTTKNPIHIYTTQNIFDVRLIAINNGTQCTDSITKKLNNIHPLEALFTFNDDTVCQGFQINFKDTSKVPLFTVSTYYWDFGDGATDTLKDPFHTYDHPGVYQVMHVVTDFIPCHDTIYHTFVVDSAGVMGVTLSDTSICQGDQVMFTGDFTDIGLNKYVWDFSDGVTVSDVNPISHTYDVYGNFAVKLSGNYRACPNVDSTVNIHVRPYPSINIGPDTTLCPNGPGIVIGDYQNQNNAAASWLWSTGDSTALITVRHPGVYTARVTEDGCSTADSVEIFKDCYIDIPTSFSPNGDGTNDYFLPRQLLSKSVNKFTMQVFNRWGEVVFTTEKIDGRGWDGRFNGKDQPLGVYVYLIDVEFENGSKEHYQGNVTLLR